MVMSRLVDRANNVGPLFRFITPLMLGVVSFMLGVVWWVVVSMHQDIKDLRAAIDQLRENVVYKCDYAEDLEYTRRCMEKLADRVDAVN